MMKIARDFQSFLVRGNVVDLAVGIAMGAAFVAVVNSLVKDLITPIIAAITGDPDFSNLTFSINDSVFHYGSFINAVVAFITVATAIFFFVVTPYNTFLARMRQEPSPDPTTRKCPFCTSEISLQATRCAFCTSELSAGPA